MDLPAITPRWARLGIIPAVVGFGVFTIGLAVMFVLGSISEPQSAWIMLLGGAPIVGLFGVATYRGIDLCRFRNYCAALQDGTLNISERQGSPSRAFAIEDLEIHDHPYMQVVYVKLACGGHKLLAVDYYYRSGMSLIASILEQQDGEQGAADRPLSAALLRALSGGK